MNTVPTATDLRPDFKNVPLTLASHSTAPEKEEIKQLISPKGTITGMFRLKAEEIQTIHQLLKKGVQNGRVIRRAIILQLSHHQMRREEIQALVGASSRTVSNVRTRYREKGLEHAIYDQARTGRPKKVTKALEGQVIALHYHEPPPGLAQWTYDQLHQAGQKRFEWSVSRTTIYQISQHYRLKPGRRRIWCINEITPEYLKQMYQVLDLYAEPYDPKRPVICLDEKLITIRLDKKPPQNASVKHDRRVDYHYKRVGTMNAFVMFEPLTGRRLVQLTAHRTKQEFALAIQVLVEHYTEAVEIRLVCDNLNTHLPDSLRAHLPPEIAERILKLITWSYTPVHASWLNMAENEISVLERQCLARRFESIDQLITEIQSWQDRRNAEGTSMIWTFNVQNAREMYEPPSSPAPCSSPPPPVVCSDASLSLSQLSPNHPPDPESIGASSPVDSPSPDIQVIHESFAPPGALHILRLPPAKDESNGETSANVAATAPSLPPPAPSLCSTPDPSPASPELVPEDEVPPLRASPPSSSPQVPSCPFPSSCSPLTPSQKLKAEAEAQPSRASKPSSPTSNPSDQPFLSTEGRWEQLADQRRTILHQLRVRRQQRQKQRAARQQQIEAQRQQIPERSSENRPPPRSIPVTLIEPDIRTKYPEHAPSSAQNQTPRLPPPVILQLILTYLQSVFPLPQSLQAIAQVVQLHSQTTQKYLAQLSQQNKIQIVKIPLKGKGRPKKGYLLRHPASDRGPPSSSNPPDPPPPL